MAKLQSKLWGGAIAPGWPRPKTPARMVGESCWSHLNSMDYIGKVLEKIRDWAQRVVDSLLGPQAEPEPELIPIPTNDRRRR